MLLATADISQQVQAGAFKENSLACIQGGANLVNLSNGSAIPGYVYVHIVYL